MVSSFFFIQSFLNSINGIYLSKAQLFFAIPYLEILKRSLIF